MRTVIVSRFRWLAAGASWLAVSVSAQDAPVTNAEGYTPEEVVVTARRREESIQDVPVAVSAFNMARLEELAIGDNRDLSRSVPSLFIDQGGFGSTSTNMAMRGITTPGSNISFDPTIGIYVDEVYRARNYGTLFDLFDVAGVQVLRGVQGTLFGRNNIGGAVLVTTNKPTFDAEARLDAGAGNLDARRLSGVVNVPLIDDTLAVRLAAKTATGDGWGRNVNNGQRLETKDMQIVRASALFTPSSSSQFDLSYERTEYDQTGPIFSPREPAGRVVRPGLGFYDVAYDTPEVSDTGIDWNVNGRASIDLGSVSTKLIASHLKGDGTVVQDVDATDYSTPTLPNVNFKRRTAYDQTTVEFQVLSNAAESLKWVAGLYYLEESAYQPTLNVVFNTRTKLWVDNKSEAAFAHFDYDISPSWQVGAGARYTRDEKQESYGADNVATGVCTPAPPAIRAYSGYDPATCVVDVAKDASYWSWDANVNYRLSAEVMLYARAGRGQKSGGFNSAIVNAADLDGYLPEVATDYEVGVKSDLFDQRVRLNAALFQTDYDDVQRSRLVLVGTPPTQSTALSVSNAARARIRGAELEFGLNGDAWEWMVNYSYVDPEYLDFTTLNSSGQVVDQSNFPFAFVSEHQLGTDFRYRADLSIGQLSSTLSYAYRSTYSAVPVIEPLLVQDGYGVLGARISFEPSSVRNLSISAWGQNLTDEHWITHGASSGAIRFAGPGRPRMYGIDIGYRFDF
jgi:iron complex outermembrane receptor protein